MYSQYSKNERARELFYQLKLWFTSEGWSFDPHEDDLVIVSGVKGDDLPIKFLFSIREEQEILLYMSELPFSIPQDKLVETAVAVCYVNDKILNGSFDLSFKNNRLTFKLCTSYYGGTLTQNTIEYMVRVAYNTIEMYNDKLYLLIGGNISLNEFMSEVDKLS